MRRTDLDLRHEVKATAPEAYLPRLRSHLRLHPAGFTSIFHPRQVNNVYLDTHDLSRLNQNYAGVPDRCKVRFRWYGDAVHDVTGNIEFKMKTSQLGTKKHCRIQEAMDFRKMSWTEFFRILQREMPAEYWYSMQNLNRPTLINRYQREYYATPDRVVRVTVDTHQEFYDQLLTPRPNLTFPLPPVPDLVLEIKGPAAAEDRIAEILNGLPLLRSRNSKYVTGTERGLGLG